MNPMTKAEQPTIAQQDWDMAIAFGNAVGGVDTSLLAEYFRRHRTTSLAAQSVVPARRWDSGAKEFVCGADLPPASSLAAQDDDEAYEIGKRDGYEQAVQDIDVMTGGDGEYRYCTNGDPDRHTPDAATMKARIAERFNAKPSLAAQNFQKRVEPWFRECFPPTVCDDRLERGDRLLEEVLELLQSGDYPPDRVAALVDYTWGRPKGEPVQEVGGVMVTLAAYCIAHGLDMGEAGEIELARINRPEIVQKIRAKQAAKPTGSALPVAPSLAAQDGLVEALEVYADTLCEFGTSSDACGKCEDDVCFGCRARKALSAIKGDKS